MAFLFGKWSIDVYWSVNVGISMSVINLISWRVIFQISRTEVVVKYIKIPYKN